MRRYQQRVDANQADVVEAFRKAGCTVAIVNDLFDLAVGYGGISMLVEVKDGNKPLKKGRQKEFHDAWTGGIRLVRGLEDVPPAVETLRRWHSAICSTRNNAPR